MHELQMLPCTIIIPTKDRVGIITQLLNSIGSLDDVETISPEIVIVDNDSADDTYATLKTLQRTFPPSVRVIQVPRRGKSAALNEGLKIASGKIIAFLDDDVVVDRKWLSAMQAFFRTGRHLVGQGVIRLAASEADDPELLRMIERYRTIPRLEYKRKLTKLHSLNGANFFAAREVFDRIGGFDERLGPGASGTSEDVEFARRLLRANISIGYAPEAIVYHRVDRDRLTEGYFKQSHWRQGASRFLIRNHSAAAIAFNLARAAAQYVYHSVAGNERNRYRSKGRIYHYLGMIEARRNRLC